MPMQPTPAESFRPAIDFLRPLNAAATDPDRRAAYCAAMPAYSRLDDAFVLGGQTDTEVRDEARELMLQKSVAPVAAVLRSVIERRAAIQCRDPAAPGWVFLDLADVAARAAIASGLNPFQAYWLALATYCAIIAYGPAGAALPELPRSPEQMKLSGAERYARVHLAFVPGDEPRQRFGGGDDDDAGMPVAALILRR